MTLAEISDPGPLIDGVIFVLLGAFLGVVGWLIRQLFQLTTAVATLTANVDQLTSDVTQLTTDNADRIERLENRVFHLGAGPPPSTYQQPRRQQR